MISSFLRNFDLILHLNVSVSLQNSGFIRKFFLIVAWRIAAEIDAKMLQFQIVKQYCFFFQKTREQILLKLLNHTQ